MSERVTTDLPGYSRPRGCLFDGLLYKGFADMMPSDRPASRIYGKSLGRKHILPPPFRCRLWIFTGQRRPDKNPGDPLCPVLSIQNFHPGQTDRVMAATNLGFQGIYQGSKKALNLTGNGPVAKAPSPLYGKTCGSFLFFCLCSRIGRGFRSIIGKKRLIKNLHGMLSLSKLPILDAGAFAQFCKETLNILPGSFTQSFSRLKINKALRPFDVKGRNIRPHPVLLHTGPKCIPKPLSGYRLILTFIVHKTFSAQLFSQLFTPDAIRNYYIIGKTIS